MGETLFLTFYILKMRNLPVCVVGLLVAGSAFAVAPSHPIEMDYPKSGKELEIAMAPGGGFALRLVRDATDGLRRRIDAAAAAGGGRVVVPAGTWVTKPLRLKSGVELHLEKGARLVASGDLGDYLEWTDVRHIAHPEALPRGRNASLILADEAHDIAITGEGTIDCNGAAFVREKTAKDVQMNLGESY